MSSLETGILGSTRDADQGWHEHCGGANVVHESRDHATCHHDRRDETGFLVARQPLNATAQSVCDPRLEQPTRHDIDRPNGDHSRVGKAIKDIVGIDKAEQANGQ